MPDEIHPIDCPCKKCSDAPAWVLAILEAAVFGKPSDLSGERPIELEWAAMCLFVVTAWVLLGAIVCGLIWWLAK